MKKTILLLLIFSSYLFSNIHAIVSILPEQTLLKAIGGDKVDISLMVQVGNSPHTYEPKASQMIAISKADLYFSIDVEFEHVWLPKFRSLNTKMSIIDITKGIEKTSIHHEEENHNTSEHKEHEHEGLDPHIWTSPTNVKIIVTNMYDALRKIDPTNTNYYKHNLDAYLASIEQTHQKIKKILSDLKNNRTFMVFHPSWGYFAKTYNLEQLSVEVEGKSPKPKELVKLIKTAKSHQVRAIFTQPEFSDTSAKIIANELHIPVVKVSPLAPNWSENLLNIAKTIAGQK